MAFTPPTRPADLAAIVSGLSLGPVVGAHSKVFLLPGQLHVSAEPCQFTTILGSCVAVCLWDARKRVGGVNHFILPACREGQGPSTRFGDVAIQELLREMTALGCRREHLKAKLFGGAAVLAPQNGRMPSLGAQNVDCARRLLKEAAVHIVAEDVGGTRGRKVIFHSDDGSAWSRPV